MKALENSVALITGGNSGIGLATAKLFVAEGAKVIITGRSSQSVEAALKELGPNASGIVIDVTNMKELNDLKNRVEKYHSSIDVLFVNAGYSLGIPIADTSEEQFDLLFNTNVKGAYFTIKNVLPLMNANGSIILNSSATVHRGFPGLSVYAATKAALSSFAKTLSVELLPRGIRVNVVSPGPIVTPLYDKMGFPLEKAIAAYTDTVPMKRFGQPEEIASIVKFLASSESSFIIGEEIIAGGGVGTL
jgi:NAD(P)-dependent dehydrogenase (short-subunit alcohol dehydrogenase family)